MYAVSNIPEADMCGADKSVAASQAEDDPAETLM